MFSVLIAMAGGVWAQAPSTVDCSINGQHATCSRETLLRRFAEAKTVAVDSVPRSRSGETQVKSEMVLLGKQIAAAGASADITLHLVQTPPEGINVGVGDSELATLQVFWSKPGQERRLLWVERYLGHADRPWPAMVQVMTQHFQATLAGE
jgi:hypothetical protein